MGSLVHLDEHGLGVKIGDTRILEQVTHGLEGHLLEVGPHFDCGDGPVGLHAHLVLRLHGVHGTEGEIVPPVKTHFTGLPVLLAMMALTYVGIML